MGKKDPDYYPLRWKVADAAEDIWERKRARAIVLVVLLLALLGVMLYFALGNDDSDTAAAATSTTSGPTESTASEAPAVTETTPETAGTETTSSTTPDSSAPDTTSTTSTTSSIPPIDDDVFARTTPGAVFALSDEGVTLIGGAPNETAAMNYRALAGELFDDLEIIDEQAIDSRFDEPDFTTVLISGPGLFGYNSNSLSDEYQPFVLRLAQLLMDNPDAEVEVIGHTDTVGPAGGNQRLSEARAAAAAQLLIDAGADPESVTSRGEGENIPIADESTEAGRQQNRRLEFRLNTTK